MQALLNFFSELFEILPLLLFFSFFAAFFSLMQWIGYRYIQKEKTRYLPLFLKGFLGIIILVTSVYIIMLYPEASFINLYGIITSIILIILIYVLLIITWALLMSKWSPSFSINSAFKASFINYILFTLLITSLLIFEFPSKKIKRLSNPVKRDYSTCIDAKCTINIDSILSIIPEKKVLFQYNYYHFGQSSYFEVYQVHNNKDLINIQNLVGEQPTVDLHDFFKVENNQGDSIINKERIFPFYFLNYFKENKGFMLSEIVESLQHNKIYFETEELQSYYVFESLEKTLINSNSGKFIKKRIGLDFEDENYDQICDRYELHILFDEKNNLIYIYRETLSTCGDDGP